MPESQPITGNVFVATGEDGLRAFSRDGITWTHQQTDREGTLLSQVCFASGRCMAGGKFGGDRLIFSTLDGVKWESAKLPGQPYVTRLEVLFIERDQFAAVVNSDGEIPGLLRSKDGKVWDARTPILDDAKVLRRDAHLRRVAFGNGLAVIAGDYGARLARKDGSSKFDAVMQAAAKDTLIDLAFGNGCFVGGGLHGLRMRSTDGLDWTDRTVGEEGEHINAMIFDGRQFVGIGQGATYASTDGKTWQRTPNENSPTVAAFGDGIYVGSLWPGKLLRSTDGVHWKPVLDLPQHILGLGYGKLGVE